MVDFRGQLNDDDWTFQTVPAPRAAQCPTTVTMLLQPLWAHLYHPLYYHLPQHLLQYYRFQHRLIQQQVLSLLWCLRPLYLLRINRQVIRTRTGKLLLRSRWFSRLFSSFFSPSPCGIARRVEINCPTLKKKVAVGFCSKVEGDVAEIVSLTLNKQAQKAQVKATGVFSGVEFSSLKKAVDALVSNFRIALLSWNILSLIWRWICTPLIRNLFSFRCHAWAARTNLPGLALKMRQTPKALNDSCLQLFLYVE